MLIYDNIYTWEGGGTKDHSLWLLSCHLWIIDLSLSQTTVTFMKPKIVVASDLNEGPKRKICAETLGRQIFRDFNLDIRRTLWVEYDPTLPAKMTAATMVPKYHDGTELIYTIQWRKLLENERKIIDRFIPSLSRYGIKG